VKSVTYFFGWDIAYWLSVRMRANVKECDKMAYDKYK